MLLPVKLALKRSGLDPKRRALEITADDIQYDGKSMACGQISEVKYGSLRMEGTSTGAWISDIHEFQLRAADGEKLRITFSASFGKSNKKAAEETFLAIEDGIREAITDRIARKMNESIAAGGQVTVGSVNLGLEGVHFKQGLIRKKDIQIPWGDLAWSVENGELGLRSSSDPKSGVALKLLGVWNAVALACALELRTLQSAVGVQR